MTYPQRRSVLPLFNDSFCGIPFLRLVLVTFVVLLGCSRNKRSDSNRNTNISNATSLEVFQEGDKYGYRDMAGTVIIKPQFVEAGEFSWGLARVKPYAKGGWGFIDATGNMVLPPQYEAAGDFADGIAVVLNKGQFIYIGPDGGSLGTFEEDHQSKPLAVGGNLYVIHPKGLIERSSAELSAAPITQVPPGSIVTLASDSRPSKTESVEGLLGTWIFIRYKGKTGYLFDLYLSRCPADSEHRPVERYRLISSSLDNDEYSVYDLTKFATGGRTIVHNGPNWTESREIVPEISVDQVVARLKLNPSGELGTLAIMFHGQSGTNTTEKGDTVIANLHRDPTGFLEDVSFSRRNEESTFEADISKYGFSDVQITTATSTKPIDTDR